VVVIVQRDAAIDMLFSAVETYAVRGSKPKTGYTEMYGICLGYPLAVGNKVIINVESFVPQLRAVGTTTSVTPSRDSKFEHMKLLESYLIDKRIVGECHTHPYRNFKEMMSVVGGAWNPSQGDNDYSHEEYPLWLKTGHRPEIEIIIAIAEKAKAKDHSNKNKFGPNTARFLHGNLEVIFAAHRLMRNGRFEPSNHCNTTVEVRL